MNRITLIVLTAVLALAAPAGAQTPPATDGGRVYGGAEYLLWWMKNSPTPVPLVTNGSASLPRTFLGGDDVDFGHHNGVRGTLGFWFTDTHSVGLELGGFYLSTAHEVQSISSPGGPGSQLLAVPFFNPVVGAERVSPISGSTFQGTATEKVTNRLWGAEGNAVMGLMNQPGWRMELLAGMRYLNLRERLGLTTSSPDIPPIVVSVFNTEDGFNANNDFYGGQLGIRGRYTAGPFMMNGTLKVAVGAMRQNVDISGSLVTDIFSPVTGSVRNFVGGYFAQPTNIGSHSRDVVAVVPEAGINFGLKLTNWVTLVAGYTFLYANNVVRPGNQVDRVINPSQAPAISLNPNQTLTGTAAPHFKFEGSDFWAHGANIGLAFSF